jgi:putative phosphoribosyl transferase
LTATIIENPAYRNRTSVFRDRFEAGMFLANELQKYAGNTDVFVLAVPAGGVPVAYMIAKGLDAPLDVRWLGRFRFHGVPKQVLAL